MSPVAPAAAAKKKPKKGKTLTLTDFLAEDGGGGGGPTYIPKPVSWADETDDLEGERGIPGARIPSSGDGIASPQSSICRARMSFLEPGRHSQLWDLHSQPPEQQFWSQDSIPSSQSGISSSGIGIPSPRSSIHRAGIAFSIPGHHSEL